MKVNEVTANGSDVLIVLEPENPAEIAILRLLNACDAKCSDVIPPGDDKPKDGCLVTAKVKTGRGY